MIREAVKEILDSTDLVDPHQVAEVVLDDLEDAVLRDALAECLPQFVRMVFSSQRSNGRVDTGQGDFDTHTESAGSARSSKWVSARRSLFREPVYANDEWHQLGDLTVADVSWLVDERDRQAKELMVTRDRWDALRDLMRRRKAKRVRDLPEDKVAEVLS